MYYDNYVFCTYVHAPKTGSKQLTVADICAWKDSAVNDKNNVTESRLISLAMYVLVSRKVLAET